MSNVSNPSGPVNPVNPQKPTEPAKPGTDKFKDLMKIDSSAEKQKKRKKRPAETEEEEKAKLRAGPAEPDKHVTSAKKPGKYPKIQKIGESEKKQAKHEKRPEETTSELAREEAAALAQKKQAQPLDVSKIHEKTEETEEAIKTTASSAASHKELEQIIEEEEAIAQREEKAENFKQIVTKKEESKKESIQQQPATAPSTTTPAPLFLSPPTTAAPAYSLLNSETLALFEKMVSVITIMKDSGVTETTLNLSTPEFENSQLYGAQIIIREYSTAPLAYNIEFMGNPLAADLFRKNLPLLRSAFDDPKYRFRINRLEASISPHPRVERKKDSSDKEKS